MNLPLCGEVIPPTYSPGQSLYDIIGRNCPGEFAQWKVLTPEQHAHFEKIGAEFWMELKALSARVEAEGWPKYSVDPDLCMERAKEYLDGEDVLIERAASTPDSGASPTVCPVASTPDLKAW